MKWRNGVSRIQSPPGGHDIEASGAVTLDVEGIQRVSVFNDADEARPAVSETVGRHLVTTLSQSHKCYGQQK